MTLSGPSSSRSAPLHLRFGLTPPALSRAGLQTTRPFQSPPPCVAYTAPASRPASPTSQSAPRSGWAVSPRPLHVPSPPPGSLFLLPSPCSSTCIENMQHPRPPKFTHVQAHAHCHVSTLAYEQIYIENLLGAGRITVKKQSLPSRCL